MSRAGSSCTRESMRNNQTVGGRDSRNHSVIPTGDVKNANSPREASEFRLV